MTRRSKLYFKFKKAFKVISHPNGRRYLESLGVYPVPFTVESSAWGDKRSANGYFIDKKGNIVGTTIRPSGAKTLHVQVPVKTSYKAEFKFNHYFSEEFEKWKES